MSERDVFRFRYSLCDSSQKDEAEIMIYSDITSYKWSKDDPAVTAVEFDKMLKDAKAKGATKLRLRINSPGGHVDQAVAMQTMLNNSDFEEINVDIEGMCASAATFFVTVNNAHVRIADGSEFMIHNPWSGCIGTASDFEREASRMRKMEEGMQKRYALRTGLKTEKIKEWMDAETWFTAEEAVANGFADELMNIPAVAACANADAYALMNKIYNAVPAGIAPKQAKNTVSHAETPVASNSAPENKKTNKDGANMDINNLTADQLKAENPALYDAIRNQGAAEERERVQQIDSLTDEGFEDLAAEAKRSGATPADFLKSVISARAEKKKNFLQNRAAETAPAAKVTGGASQDNDRKNDEASEIEKNAKEMSDMAKQLSGSYAGMY